MGQIVGGAAKPKRCNLNKLSQLGTPAAGEYILVSSDNSMNAAGQGNFDCYIVGDGRTAAAALELKNVNDLQDEFDDLFGHPEAYTPETTLTQGYMLVSSSGSVTTGASYSVSDKIYLNGAKEYKWWETESTYPTVCAYKEDDTYLGPIAKTGKDSSRQFPAGTAYIRYCAMTSRMGGFHIMFIKDVKGSIYEYIDQGVESLQTDIDNIEEELNEKTTIDAISIYDGVLANRIIYESNGKTAEFASYEIRYRQVTKDTTFRYNVQRLYQVVAKSSALPTAATTFTILAAPNKAGEVTISAGEWIAWVVYTGTEFTSGLWLEEVIDTGKTEIQAKQLREATDYERLKDTKSNILVDGTMCLMWYENSYNTIMDVVSATTDTISVSSDDSSYFNTSAGDVAVKHSDGTYTIHLFKIEGNVLTILRRKGYDDDADMSDVVQCQGAYDTPNSGAGQHLSAFGCLGYANYIVSEIHKRRTLQQDNLVSGYFFTQQGLNNDFRGGLLYNADGSFLYAPRYNNCTFESPYNGGVKNFNNYMYRFDCYLYNYVFRQPAGASVEFDLPSKTYGMGYIEIVGCSEIVNTWVGGWQVDVLEDGVVVATQMMPVEATGKLIFDGINIGKKVSVKFTSEGKGSLNLISMGLYSAPTEQTAVPTLKSTDKIAVIGDSWTQWPALFSITIPDFEYNTVDTLANGNTAEGYCYLPKEIARLTGCQVDNYGRGGQTAVYGLTQIAQEILATGKHYDYIIFEYYINDAYQNAFSKEQWLDNVTQFVKMCKSLNARPIVISPTATNSLNQAAGLLNRFQYMKKTMFSL